MTRDEAIRRARELSRIQRQSQNSTGTNYLTPQSNQEAKVAKRVEKIKDWIYDAVKPTTGTDMTFFSDAISSTKTLTRTNMTQGGQLPFSEMFRVIGIGAYISPLFYTDTSTSDAIGWIKNLTTGNYQLKIMNKTYVRGPLSAILAQNNARINITQASGADGTVMTLDAPFYKTYGYFPIAGGEITLNNGVNFSVDVDLATAAGASNIFYLNIFLMGYRFRPIQ